MRRHASITYNMRTQGTCLDDTLAETIFANVKVKHINRQPLPTRSDRVRAIVASADTCYIPHCRRGRRG